MKTKITKFKTGAIRDTQEGKVDFVETISFTANERYARYMTGKKKKYGVGNFKKGIPIENYEQSLLRHVDKYFRNKYENGNDEPQEDHAAAMRFNVDGIMHEEEQKKLRFPIFEAKERMVMEDMIKPGKIVLLPHKDRP